MVSSYTGLEVQSTVDSFKERASDVAPYAARLVQEREHDDFTDEGDAVPASPPLSAITATMADYMDVAALAEMAPPQYISVTGSLYQTPRVDLPRGVLPMSRTTVPFTSQEGGLVVLDLFSVSAPPC